MNAFGIVVLAYLIINLVGAVYEFIRYRREVFKIIENGIKPEEFNHKQTYGVAYWAAFAIGFVLNILAWAPVKLAVFKK